MALQEQVMTELANLPNKPTNQQRAIWMNGAAGMRPKLIAHRKAELLRREAVKETAAISLAKKEEARKQKEAKKKSDASEINLLVDSSLTGFCFGDCFPIIKRCTLQIDVGWRGCPHCRRLFCAKKACQENLIRHAKWCLTKMAIYHDEVA